MPGSAADAMNGSEATVTFSLLSADGSLVTNSIIKVPANGVLGFATSSDDGSKPALELDAPEVRVVARVRPALEPERLDERGRAVINELVKRADVVHHNMRVGAMERLGALRLLVPFVGKVLSVISRIRYSPPAVTLLD